MTEKQIAAKHRKEMEKRVQEEKEKFYKQIITIWLKKNKTKILVISSIITSFLLYLLLDWIYFVIYDSRSDFKKLQAIYNKTIKNAKCTIYQQLLLD